MANPRISVDKIQIIVKMTQKNHSRRDIANAVCCSTSTVYRYQKEYNLI